MNHEEKIIEIVENVRARNHTIVRNSANSIQLVSYEQAIDHACEIVLRVLAHATHMRTLILELEQCLEQDEPIGYDRDGVGVGTLRDILNALK